MTELGVGITLLFVCSALTSFVATAIVRRGAMRIGLVDVPNERKIHQVATPRLGGLAIIFGFGFPLLLLAGNVRAAELVTKNISYLFAVLASGSLIVGLGVYDDLIGTNAPKKFIVQTGAAIILVSFGYHFTIVSLAGRVFELGFLGAVASVVWIVGVINALNFIDGIDSLATVVSLTTAVAFAVIAVLRHDTFSLVIMTALAGSLIGFWPWNKPPAKIFMGDSGSLFIGLLLAAGSIAKPSKSPTALLVFGPMLALAVPVIDTLFVMRERMRGREIPLSQRFKRLFNADKQHIHHVLVDRFGSTARAVVSIWLITLLFAVSAVMTVVQETKLYGYTSGIVAFFALALLRYWRRRGSDAAEGEPAESAST
ncbi:MAG TPA: MraY family glycosyltransferase [Thermoanaerobaculia bacterium]|jgi:UDP-GlcNAc:undecaprenyl-phosphate GlcNAc-1-phosphate transferase